MTDHTTLPLEAHDNKSMFLEDSWNIGRAYRNRALELISICQLLSRLAPPKLAHEDAELRSMRRVCDLALRSAADSGTKLTDEANSRFEKATQMLSSHSERRHRLDLPLTVYSKTEIAKWKDNVQIDWSPERFEDEWGPTMTINFVLLRSPLLTPHNSDTVIVSQELSASPSLPEILWNFSRYQDRARIILEQNPHFYLRCPAAESAYTPKFRRHPLQDTSGALEHNDTVYVLFDGPCRVFLDTEHKPRIFGNVWLLNGTLIFRDDTGVLEGEQLVRSSSIRDRLWFCEKPVVYHDSDSCSRLRHRCLRPIVTTPSGESECPRGTFEDWTVLSRPRSSSISTHIYRSRGSPGSARSLDLPPSPPTSERPGYCVLYTTINGLDDDILLELFNNYRLDDENNWNDQLGWCMLSRVCLSWRHLVHSSVFHLGIRILCTKGSPIVDTLDHLPPIPLFVDYRYATATISGQDELGIYHALRLHDRVRLLALHLPPSTLNRFLMLMHKPFPILEQLSLSFKADEITGLVLPRTFLAPNLRHLTLHGVSLPKGISSLSSTISLVTLDLRNIRASGYFSPRDLVARLLFLPQLEELSIEFSDPIPRPNAERELLGDQGTPVTLPSLRHLKFQGVSAYLECLVSQIRAPLMERLNITIFRQIAFASPHLSRFTSKTEALKLSTAVVFFSSEEVSITLDHRSTPHWSAEPFTLRVMCKQLDWQIDCAAQICSALMPALSCIEKLTLDFDDQKMPAEWQNGEIDGTTWHELLRSFIGAKQLRICDSLAEEFSRALKVDEIASDQGLLPGLQELEAVRSYILFASFVHARRVVGRPVRLLDPYILFPRS